MEKPNTFITTPVAVLLGSAIVSFAILVSGGVIQIKGLSSQTQAPQAAAQPAQAPQAPTAPTSSKVSVSDNPMLGSKDAKVTLIEFSDYECPFCKRHYDEVYPLLKKDYIDKITKDIADGGAAGVSGTPSFFVGKSDPSGVITGQLIVGAQPYTVFQSALDALLK